MCNVFLGLALAAGILVVPPSFAWEFLVQTDAFDGSKKHLIVEYNDARTQAFIVRPNADEKINTAASLRVNWQLNAQFICSTDGRQRVEWMVLDFKGTELHRTASSSWDVSTDRKSLLVSARPSLLSSQLAENEILTASMFSETAAEIRLQFTDDCGTHYLSKFSLDGFAGEMTKMAGYINSGGILPLN